MATRKLPVVFVHGWSVTNTATYGELPRRLANEAADHGFEIDVREIWLGKYISFRDEVRIEDISHAMEAAVRRDLADLIQNERRFAVVTHSTGGPVARDWWYRHYVAVRNAAACPMSHLVMLAPANFGSALAQLGKGRLSRLKSWSQGVEPGQGVLDWLELGSPEAWSLNRAWIFGRFGKLETGSVLPFVLTGQTIDRSLYDSLNSYTGELGSDGVVRVSAANLNAAHVTLAQEPLAAGSRRKSSPLAPKGRLRRAPTTPLRLISGASHSGEDMGIMRSVSAEKGAAQGAELVEAIFDCLGVRTPSQYLAVAKKFEAETAKVLNDEQVEIEARFLLSDRVFIHDRTTQVIFRVTDTGGHAVTDLDLVLTGEKDSPDQLPEGFFLDRQRNAHRHNTITYLFNYDLMVGCPEVTKNGKHFRDSKPGIEVLGLQIDARPETGFVHYLPANIKATEKLFRSVMRPNQTVMIDIVLQRFVHAGTFRLSKGIRKEKFKEAPKGPIL